MTEKLSGNKRSRQAIQHTVNDINNGNIKNAQDLPPKQKQRLNSGQGVGVLDKGQKSADNTNNSNNKIAVGTETKDDENVN